MIFVSGPAASAMADVETSVLAALSEAEAGQFRTLLHKLAGRAGSPAAGDACADEADGYAIVASCVE